MPLQKINLNTDPPRVNKIDVEVISFKRAIVRWSRPDTYQPFNEYYLSVSRNNDFPDGDMDLEDGTNNATVDKLTTSYIWDNLEKNTTHHFRIGVKNIYDNVINWSTVPAVITPISYKPKNMTKIVDIRLRSDEYGYNTIVSPLHHVRTVDEDDNCFKVKVNSESDGTTSYEVEILRPIELFHNVSIPGTWGGDIKVTIDDKWNINMSFNTTDGWRQNNQWIYGRLFFQSGNVQRESSAAPGLEKETVYTRRISFINDNNYYTNDVTDSNKDILLKAFRKGDQSRYFSTGIGSSGTSDLTKTFRGNKSPGPNEKYYLNDPDDKSIYVLRYQVIIQGYYAKTPRDDNIIVLSGDLKVKLPGEKKKRVDDELLSGYITRSSPYLQNVARIYNFGNMKDIVYNRSDCSYPYVKSYGCGGGCLESSCRNHIFPDAWLSGQYTTTQAVFPGCKGGLTFADIIWYGGEFKNILSTSSNKVDSIDNREYKARNDYNWTQKDLFDFKQIANTRDNFYPYNDAYICGSNGKLQLNPNVSENLKKGFWSEIKTEFLKLIYWS